MANIIGTIILGVIMFLMVLQVVDTEEENKILRKKLRDTETKLAKEHEIKKQCELEFDLKLMAIQKQHRKRGK